MPALEARLAALAGDTPWFMAALRAVARLELEAWCIGAGAVRNLVWDALHGYGEPSPLSDVDVAYFDAADVSAARDAALQTRLSALLPGVPWEVTNQAGVHLWFERVFGHAVEPLDCLESAIASWPETATSIGIALDRAGEIRVWAPHGLGDLFDCVVRRNPTRVSVATYQERIERKRYVERWPRVTVIAA